MNHLIERLYKSMENDIIFKKVNFGGFDREDVMNYISQITDEFHKKTADKDKELIALRAKITELESEIDDLKNENVGLKTSIEELKNENEKLKVPSESVEKVEETETEQLRNAVKALTEKVDELISDAAEKNTSSSDEKVGYDTDLFDLIEQYTD